jgi:hypothetical protein
MVSETSERLRFAMKARRALVVDVADLQDGYDDITFKTLVVRQIDALLAPFAKQMFDFVPTAPIT